MVKGALFFFFKDTATTEIYTLPLHDPLPICLDTGSGRRELQADIPLRSAQHGGDRKSTRLNSSHVRISYAVFCLKKTPPRQRAPASPCRLCACSQARHTCAQFYHYFSARPLD